MDPDNPVVRLCAQGMQAEAERRFDAARAFFEQAWAARTDDYEACIAAHYVARHQPTDADTLAWNQTALDHALAVGDNRVDALYPSLHHNLGHSHELIGDVETADAHYRLASERLVAVPDGPYRAMVQAGIEAARARVLASPRRSGPTLPYENHEA